MEYTCVLLTQLSEQPAQGFAPGASVKQVATALAVRWGSALLLLLGACTPLRPRVTLEPGVSLKGYRVFIVGPVTDETGARFNLKVTDSLHQTLVDRLQSHGLTVAAPSDTTSPALVITSTLEAFKGMPLTLQLWSPGVTSCVLRSELRDKQTGRRLGEIVASVLEEDFRPMVVLDECAHDVADAIHRQLRR